MNRLLGLFGIITLTTLLGLMAWLLTDFFSREASLAAGLQAGSAVVAPLPILIFVVFLVAGTGSSPDQESPTAQRRPVLSSVAFVVLATLVPMLSPWVPSVEDLRQSGAIPIFLNSWLLSLGFLNVLIIRNLLLAACLSGLCLGLTILIIYT